MAEEEKEDSVLEYQEKPESGRLEDMEADSRDEDFKDEEGADLEYTGDLEKEVAGDEKEEVKEVEEKEEKEEKVEEVEKEKTDEEKIADKVREDLIQHLDGKTTYRVKGKDYNLEDLSPQEVLDRFSKAGRFYERMEEYSAKEKLLDERQRTLDRGAEQVQNLMRQYEPRKPEEVKTLDVFKVDEMDSEEVKTLKGLSSGLQGRLEKLEQTTVEQSYNLAENQLLDEIDVLKNEYPVLSKEEVVVLKALNPNVPTRELAERSHRHYISDEYFDAVLEARPEKLRELEEKAVEKHLSKKQKVTKVSRRRSSSTASSKVSDKKKSGAPRTLDEIEARIDEVRDDVSPLFD